MANEEKNKEETRTESKATSPTVRELQNTVESLPRTSHMTLPAVSITKIDDETLASMKRMSEINKATSYEDEVGEQTVGEIRRKFVYGVSGDSEEGAKHEVIENDDMSVTVIPPARKITDASGEVREVKGREVTFEATPANIAPIDKDAPHDPVQARVRAGLAADGSEGDPIGNMAPLRRGGPSQPRVEKNDGDGLNRGTGGDTATAPGTGGGTGAGVGGGTGTTGGTPTTGGTTGTTGTRGGTGTTGGNTGGTGGTGGTR